MWIIKQSLKCWLLFNFLTAAYAQDLAGLKVAFLPDIHFQDIYADLDLADQPGVDKPLLIRSMKAQLHSTRLFNEPYFAFLSVLDDLASRNIKLVVLPGDFSDDGQPVHLRKLKQLFSHYKSEYGMRFYLAPGNHDPVRPWDSAHGKSDFLNNEGYEYAIYSLSHSACQTPAGEQSVKIYCHDDLRAMGYQGLMEHLGDFGFKPGKKDLYFETPFSNYRPQDYKLSDGLQAAELNQRLFSYCGENKTCIKMPDLSYLVEPVEGLWLLSIDANVYEPKTLKQDLAEISQHKRSDLLKGSSYAGYNSVLDYKPFLIEWIKQVVKRAQAENKTLLAFSHFPLGDFYDQSVPYLAGFAGKDTYNKRRFPLEKTLNTFAATGLKVHVAGHMHINDSSVYHDDKGNALFNIQAPSIAAYSPAYKLFTLHSPSQFEVQSIAVEAVEHFDTLFPYYQKERAVLARIQPDTVWSDAILSAENYREFTEFHLLGLIQSRFLGRDWQAQEINLYKDFSGYDLLTMSFVEGTFSANQLMSLKRAIKSTPAWVTAQQRASQWILTNQQTVDDWNWPVMQLIEDFYRLSNADELARREDIGENRIHTYHLLKSRFESLACSQASELSSGINFLNRLSCLILTLNQYISSEPSDHFIIDTKNNRLIAK